MFGDLWDGILETGGELIDAAVEISGDYYGHKLAADNASGNPEENRTPAELAPEQPNGTPVMQPVAGYQIPMGSVLIGAGLLVGALILAKK